jgi:hypothetical protein
LKKLYASYFRVATTSERYFEIASFGRKLHIQDIEAQVALSGQCPQLKDYWIWIHANFPMNVPPPDIDTKSLSQECYELFQESVEHHSYKILVDHKAFFSSSYRDKLDALKTLSPMAYFAEEQFLQTSKIYQSENSLVKKLRWEIETYAFLAKVFVTSMMFLFILFFLFYFLANRFYLFKKILIGSLLLSFLSTVLLWWILGI